MADVKVISLSPHVGQNVGSPRAILLFAAFPTLVGKEDVTIDPLERLCLCL